MLAEELAVKDASARLNCSHTHTHMHTHTTHTGGALAVLAEELAVKDASARLNRCVRARSLDLTYLNANSKKVCVCVSVCVVRCGSLAHVSVLCRCCTRCCVCAVCAQVDVAAWMVEGGPGGKQPLVSEVEARRCVCVCV